MSSAVFSSTGNQMVAEAMRQCAPDVVAAYPITPQTTIVEGYAKFVADGRVHTEFVAVESEHSAMSACIGASAAGARVGTATSSQGLAFMWEELPIAAGMRLPIVMANANRTLSAPINIQGDHSDSMAARDTGWIMLYAENAQEAYDNTILSFKVAEDPDVMLPVMSCLDGFVTTHALDCCVTEDDQTVADFVGNFEPVYPLLDTDNPVSHGMFANMGDVYMRSHLAVRRAIEGSLDVIEKHGKEWAETTGRPFDLVDCFETEDADYIFVTLGACAGNCRHVARQLREQGIKVGVVRPRVFRPFPGKLIAEACKNAKAVAVLNRADSMGAEHGPLAADVLSAFYDAGLNVPVCDYIVAIGGADITIKHLHSVYEDMVKRAAGQIGSELKYLGIEE